MENQTLNRERLFELIEQMQQNSGENDPDEMMALALEVQQTIRSHL